MSAQGERVPGHVPGREAYFDTACWLPEHRSGEEREGREEEGAEEGRAIVGRRVCFMNSLLSSPLSGLPNFGSGVDDIAIDAESGVGPWSGPDQEEIVVGEHAQKDVGPYLIRRAMLASRYGSRSFRDHFAHTPARLIHPKRNSALGSTEPSAVGVMTTVSDLTRHAQVCCTVRSRICSAPGRSTAPHTRCTGSRTLK